MSGQLFPYSREIPYKNEDTGFETTLYSIATVAMALGRDSQTIRKWEIAGVIPKTPFRVKGNRMYCKEQIDIIVECAEKAKICNGKRMSDTSFTKWVDKRWKDLFKKIFKEEE